MIYLLNSPILTTYGEYRFTGPVSPAQARQALAAGYTSAIGHESSAAFLSALLGNCIPVNRISIAMQAGDAALVLRLLERLPEGAHLSQKEMASVNYELAWLERLA